MIIIKFRLKSINKYLLLGFLSLQLQRQLSLLYHQHSSFFWSPSSQCGGDGVLDEQLPWLDEEDATANDDEEDQELLAKVAFSQLDLFFTTFPGGLHEFASTALRSMNFFWPKEYLKMVVILDEPDFTPSVVDYIQRLMSFTMLHMEDEVSVSSPPSFIQSTTRNVNDTTAHAANSTLNSTFSSRPNAIRFLSNPLVNRSRFGKGWYIQQLVMFWADNFSDYDYIGLCDDDTMFTQDIDALDLFDELGRPRALVRYQTMDYYFNQDEQPIRDVLHAKWHNQSQYVWGGQESYIMAMSYFPVIVKREHFRAIREAILKLHPQFACFDDFFEHWMQNRVLPDSSISQFMIMFDYLWLHHRDEYSWHFEPVEQFSQFFPNGYPRESEIANKYYPYIQKGTPAENGVKKQMLKPVMHISTHANYVIDGKFEYGAWNRYRMVAGYLMQGYCMSFLPKEMPEPPPPPGVGIADIPPPPPPGVVADIAATTEHGLEGHNNGAAQEEGAMEDGELDEEVTEPECHDHNIWEHVHIQNTWKFEEADYMDSEATAKAFRKRLKRFRPRDWDWYEYDRIFNSHYNFRALMQEAEEGEGEYREDPRRVQLQVQVQ